jgi:hypothetical protein
MFSIAFQQLKSTVSGIYYYYPLLKFKVLAAQCLTFFPLNNLKIKDMQDIRFTKQISVTKILYQNSLLISFFYQCFAYRAFDCMGRGKIVE